MPAGRPDEQAISNDCDGALGRDLRDRIFFLVYNASARAGLQVHRPAKVTPAGEAQGEDRYASGNRDICQRHIHFSVCRKSRMGAATAASAPPPRISHVSLLFRTGATERIAVSCSLSDPGRGTRTPPNWSRTDKPSRCPRRRPDRKPPRRYSFTVQNASDRFGLLIGIRPRQRRAKR